MKTLKQLKSELLADKKTRQAYEDLGPEFELIARLIEKRVGRRMSQAALAKKIGTKQSAISRFESGRYNPTLAFLNKMAGALDAKLKVTVS